MRRHGIGPVAALALTALLALPASEAVAAGDPRAAESQYKIARRLAAEGSPQAAAALERVLELDPEGPLADDALVEQARLQGIPEWPEQLGRIDDAAATRAASLLDRVTGEFPGADRAVESRLLRALLSLEPLPGRDVPAARIELLTVASSDELGTFGPVARYALGWLAELEGNAERARAAYQRLVVDVAGSEAADRARVGLGRLDLREERFAESARWLQESVERGAASATAAAELRELAVRSLMRQLGQGGSWSRSGLRASTAARNVAGLVRLPDGGIILADSRAETLTRLEASGRTLATWGLPDVQALATGPLGRTFVAAADSLFRVGPNGPERVAGQGALAPVGALAIDAVGALWVADRKGTRLGRLDPGAPSPVQVWRAQDLRASLLAWDGRRLVAVDAKTGSLFAIDSTGREQLINSGAGLQKPAGVATDPAGRIAVLDARAAAVLLYDRQGVVIERFLTGASGISRPAAIALGPDGTLDVIDAANGEWRRLP
jgi:tetratricopeptide (TPR) repeat protein